MENHFGYWIGRRLSFELESKPQRDLASLTTSVYRHVLEGNPNLALKVLAG
jgi:hypothetical protein